MKISHLHLVKGIFVPGLGTLARTVNQQFYPGIEMSLHDAGVLCKHKETTWIVPFAAAESYVVVPEEIKDAKASARKS